MTTDAEREQEEFEFELEYENEINKKTRKNLPITEAIPSNLAAVAGAGAGATVGTAKLIPKSISKAGEIFGEALAKKLPVSQPTIPPSSGPATVQGTGAQKWIPAMTGVDVPGGQMSKAGFDTGNKLASIVQQGGPFAGGEVRSGVAIPPDIKGTRTPPKPAAPSAISSSINKMGQAVGPYVSAAGKFLNPIAGGAGVGYGSAEAYNRAKAQDIPGAIIAGTGALGSAVSMVPGLVPSLVGNTVALGAEQLNKYRDEGWPYTKKRRPDQSNINDDPNRASFGFFPQMDVKEENADADKFAQGGLAQHYGIGGSVEKLIAHINKAGKTPVVPAPNRWFANPEKFPQVQGMVNKTLEHSGLPREEFHSGAFIDPRTGEVLDRNIYDELGVVIDPKTGKPMMSAGKQSGLEVLDPKTGSYTKSNLVRKSLFTPTGGDELLKRLPFIATVEKGGTHHYGLGTEYATPAELYNTMKGDNPTLRPRSRGDVFGMGDVVGQATIGGRGIPRDIYESLFVAPKGSDVPGVKLNKSAGGHIAGYKGGSSVSLFDEQGNPIRQDENVPTQADIDYEKMLAEQNSTPSPKFTARNRAGQPVDPTANIVGPAIEALGNTIYGAGRGALTAMAGLPGDINKLITDNIGTAFNAPALPTTEEIQNFLPGQPTSHEGKISQKLGEFVPVNPMPAVRVAGKGAKALGETAAEKILTGQPMVPGAGFLNPEMMFAVKPKGGNWRTNIGSIAPLKEQGRLGAHLDASMLNPKQEWWGQLDNEPNWVREEAHKLSNLDEINNFTNLWNQNPANTNKIKSFSDIKEKTDAYNKWLLNNYQNYITKQMGTGVKTDPMLAEIEKANSNLFTKRNWDDTPWVTPEKADLKRDIALGEFLYKEGNDASLPQNQYVGKQTATSEAGKEYENLQDNSLSSLSVGGDNVLKNPGLKNLDRKDRIFDFFSTAPDNLGLTKLKNLLLQDVLSGKMSIDKLPNTSVGSLVKKLIDEDAIRIKALNKDKDAYNAYKVERFNALPAQTQFEDGTKMLEFSKENSEDPIQLLRDLGVDCKDLNHCVVASHRDNDKYIPALEPHTGSTPKGSTGTPAQSYYQGILDGRTKLLSLRDTTGSAQATLQQGRDGVQQIKGYADKEIKPEFIPHIKQWLNNNAGDAPVRDMQNIPGVFDMKSPKLLENETSEKYPELEKILMNALSKMSPERLKDYENDYLSPKNIFPNMPRFVDIDDLKNADSFSPKPEFKKGGHVSPAWQRSEGKSESGGLNAAGRASYHRETGGTLKAPQPEGGSRKDSFCARMEGMKKKLTSSETARDPDSRINKSLRKWNC